MFSQFFIYSLIDFLGPFITGWQRGRVTCTKGPQARSRTLVHCSVDKTSFSQFIKHFSWLHVKRTVCWSFFLPYIYNLWLSQSQNKSKDTYSIRNRTLTLTQTLMPENKAVGLSQLWQVVSCMSLNMSLSRLFYNWEIVSWLRNNIVPWVWADPEVKWLIIGL